MTRKEPITAQISKIKWSWILITRSKNSEDKDLAGETLFTAGRV